MKSHTFDAAHSLTRDLCFHFHVPCHTIPCTTELTTILQQLDDSFDANLNSQKRKLDSFDANLNSLKRKLDSFDVNLNSLKRKLDSFDANLNSQKRKLDSFESSLRF